MATLAMSEAAALSGDSELRDRVRRAVDYIVKTQTPNGGWNYYGNKEIDDIPVTAWQIQALAAARSAGISVPDEVFLHAQLMMQKATVGDRVMFRLQQDDKVYTPGLAGMALMTRQLCGERPENSGLRPIATKLATFLPVVKLGWAHGWEPTAKDAPERSKFDPYMLYFATYGMFFAGGSGLGGLESESVSGNSRHAGARWRLALQRRVFQKSRDVLFHGAVRVDLAGAPSDCPFHFFRRSRPPRRVAVRHMRCMGLSVI